MARLRTVLLLSFLALSCGGKGTARFRGHWQGIEAQGIVKGGDSRIATEFASSMELFVRGRELTLVYRGRNQEKITTTTPYRIVRDDGNRITVETDLDKTEQSQFEFPGENTLLWDVTDTSKIRFERIAD